MPPDPLTTAILASRDGPPRAALGFTAVTAAVLGLIVVALLAPRIEAAAFPPIGRLSVDPMSVVRSPSPTVRGGERLCWRRTVYKTRLLDVSDYDVVLSRVVTVDGRPVLRRSFPEVVFGDGPRAGEPVTSEPVNGLGWTRRLYCLELPTDVVRDHLAVRVRTTVLYRGLWGLWDVPVRTPDVVENGAPP